MVSFIPRRPGRLLTGGKRKLRSRIFGTTWIGVFAFFPFKILYDSNYRHTGSGA